MNDKLANALAELAAQLGTTVPYLWQVMVHGVAYRALADVAGWALFAAVCAFVAWKAIKLDRNRESDILINCMGWILGCVFVASTFAALSSMTDAAVALSSPEYAALEKIMRIAR